MSVETAELVPAAPAIPAVLVAPRRRPRSTWQQIKRRPAMLCWCLFLLLSPLYVLPVGLPQPADFLLFVLAPLAFFEWDRRFDKPTARTLRPLLWFTLWVALVNYGWALVLWKFNNRRDFIVHPLY